MAKDVESSRITVLSRRRVRVTSSRKKKPSVTEGEEDDASAKITAEIEAANLAAAEERADRQRVEQNFDWTMYMKQFALNDVVRNYMLLLIHFDEVSQSVEVNESIGRFLTGIANLPLALGTMESLMYNVLFMDSFNRILHNRRAQQGKWPILFKLANRCVILLVKCLHFASTKTHARACLRTSLTLSPM